MARIIRFQLIMKDGAAIRTIEELREHFDLRTVLGYFTEGKLVPWLERGREYYDDLAQAVGQLTPDMPDLAEKLCKILGVENKTDEEDVDIQDIQQQNEKQLYLSNITANQDVLDNVYHVAMNQEELQDLLTNPPDTIYLCDGPFNIPSTNKNIQYINIQYIGVNQPMATIEKGKLISDYKKSGITLKDIKYISPYRTKAETKAERLYIVGRYAEALSLLEEVANDGNPRAMYVTALCYKDGFGTPIDMKKCKEWLQRTLGMKEPLSTISYAYICCDNNDDKKEIFSEYPEELRAMALSGDYLAQIEYGNYILEHQDIENAVQESSMAVKWFRQAAEQGMAKAQYNLALCYYNGKGIEKDYVKATEWYSKAAEQGYAEAQHNLGACYYNGKGVENDSVKAAEWYLKAAEQGHANAQYELGYMYEQGYGVEQNDVKAEEWYTRAAEKGHKKASIYVPVRRSLKFVGNTIKKLGNIANSVNDIANSVNDITNTVNRFKR